MGLIKAFTGALGGTLADQWLDYLAPSSGVSPTAVVFPAVRVADKRSSNTKGSANVITNGSKIIVPDGTVLVIAVDGKVVDFVSEAGGYIWNSGDENSESIMNGDGLGSIKKSFFSRLKAGGTVMSQHLAIYINTKEIPSNKFGTKSEIYWDDAFLGTQVGAICRGTYSLRVVDPMAFVNSCVPVRYLQPNGGVFDLGDMGNEVCEQLFNEVVGSLSSAFSIYSNNAGGRIARIQSDSVGFASALGQAVEEAYSWSSRGISIVRTAIVSIDYDEDTKKLLSDVKKADALSGSRGNSFMQQAIARGMQSAGEKGGADGMAFMGMAMGAGNMAMGYQQPQGTTEDAFSKLAELKKMLDAGLITEEDYNKAKAKYLGI